MAGESPDKSEQRKSSGPVPEAPPEQDPRFAVFREAADAAPAGSSAGPEGSADRSTAVFTVRGARDGSEAPEAAEAPVAAAEASSTAEPEAESEAEAEAGVDADAVRPARPEPVTTEESAEPEPEPELESTTEPKSDPEVTPPKPESAASPDAESRPGRSDAEAAAPTSERKLDASPSGPVAEPAVAASPDAESGPGRPMADQTASGAEAGVTPAKPGATAEPRLDAAPAVPDAESELAPAKPTSAPEPRLDAASARSVSGQTASGADAEAAPAEPEGTSGLKRDAAPAAGAESELARSEADAIPAKPERAPAPDGTPGHAPSGAKADATPAKPTAAPGSRPGAASAAGSALDAESELARPEAGVIPAKRGSAPAPDGTPSRPEADADPAEPGRASEPQLDAAPSRPEANATPAEPGTRPAAQPAADGGAGEVGVDRQTAVFKALKRPGVDQPTAMLKLPPQPPAPAQPELPAERTSKFVPLRADEVRAAAPGSPAGAGVAEAERTRQQPMPPLPPLDLLAELTNKPAPPETPTRTVVRRVKIWTPLLVLVLIIFAVAQAVRPLPESSLSLTAKSAYTFEGDQPALPWPGEGQGFMAATGLGTVDSFGEQKAVPIGSVAKAMTAYVVLKDHPLKKGAEGPSITVDAKAEEDGGLDAQGESTLNTVKEGDKLTQQDALAALMIPSANNIARLLARWDANGSEEAFVKKMNDTAEELGMKNTKYTDPSGLDATTVSSAEDQVKLGQELVEIEALMDITKLPEWTDPSGKVWRNYNTLVPYDGALGIKTGSTTKAGGNLLFAAHKMVGETDQLVVGAVLGQHKSPIIDTVNAVSKDVMLATRDELESATIVKKGTVVGEVDNGMGTTVPVVATQDVKAVGWSGLTVKLELTDDGEAVPQSAAAGTHVGTLSVGEGKSQVKVAVALQGDLAEPTFGDKLTRVG
ncbi:hypothetical protein [Streptomyces sp. NBC_01508]|uniref:hypothetical protein n=1 Tax=Streptomyces sp. NBC_01508 TaxID=2903888 RepID=UPI003869E6F1